MSQYYCLSCGNPNEYSFTKPRFCQGCGQPLDGVAVAAIQPTKIIKKPKVQVIEEEDEENEYESQGNFPDKLSVSIEGWAPPRKLKIEELGRPSESFGGQQNVKKLSKKERTQKVQEFRNRLQNTQRHDVGGA